MEPVMRGWIGEARVEDPQRSGELTTQVVTLSTRAFVSFVTMSALHLHCICVHFRMALES